MSKIIQKGFFVASTGQHVGKTTTCLGLISGLIKQYKSVGFLKPIGQEHIETKSGIHVDKDVLLFKEHFSLQDDLSLMSPILFPRGFTRDYIDGKIEKNELKNKIENAFRKIQLNKKCVVVEGTGHVGVGSIVNFSNAKVASILELKMILVASGGLGSSFDALAVNKALCDAYNVPIAGIILNRVLDDKREMVLHYMEKALKTWEIPILGCIPFDPFLSKPSMRDFELLFHATLLTGQEHYLRYFQQTRLVATSLKNFQQLIFPSELIITPSNREDIILAILTKHWDVKIANPLHDLKTGMILTGDHPPRQTIIEALRKANIPMLYVPLSSYQAMEKITSYTVKIRQEDKKKIEEAIGVVEKHIDFHKLSLAVGLKK